MPYASSPQLRTLIAIAEEITSSVIAAHAEREDAEALWPEPAMRALADAGLMGLHVPVELGGHGQGLAGLVAISETLAQESPSTALCYAMHCVGTAVRVEGTKSFVTNGGRADSYVVSTAATRSGEEEGTFSCVWWTVTAPGWSGTRRGPVSRSSDG